MTENSPNPDAATQLRHEINRIIYRYGQESDVTVYQSIGVIRMVEHDLVAALDKIDRDREAQCD